MSFLPSLCRYYNAWIETFSEEQFKKNSGVDLSIQSDLSFSGSGDETSESCDSDLESEEELSGHDSTGKYYYYCDNLLRKSLE